jgi:hypothetical protein
MFWLGIILGFLAALAGIRYVMRLRETVGSASATLTDEQIRRIEDEGWIAVGAEDEEPLDLDDIAQEEERFWTESWDEPEDY